MIKQKLIAIDIMLTTLPAVLLEHDCTVMIIAAVFAVPLLFSRKRWAE